MLMLQRARATTMTNSIICKDYQKKSYDGSRCQCLIGIFRSLIGQVTHIVYHSLESIIIFTRFLITRTASLSPNLQHTVIIYIFIPSTLSSSVIHELSIAFLFLFLRFYSFCFTSSSTFFFYGKEIVISYGSIRSQISSLF